MRRLIIAAMMIALLPAAAYSQQDKGPATVRSDKEMKDDATIDKAYQDTVKRMGGNAKAPKSDPWQTVRPAADDSTKH
jgi:hypothetical protein